MWGPGAAWLPAAVLTRDREPGTRTRLGKGVRTRPHPRPPHTDDSERARHSPSGNDPRPAPGLSAGRAASGRKSSVLSVSHWSPATLTPAQGRSEAAQKAARLLFSSSRKCLSSGEKRVGRGGVRRRGREPRTLATPRGSHAAALAVHVSDVRGVLVLERGGRGAAAPPGTARSGHTPPPLPVGTPRARHTCRVSGLSCRRRPWWGQVPRSPASKNTARSAPTRKEGRPRGCCRPTCGAFPW